MAKLLIVYYSAYGHIYDMAIACGEAAKQAGAEVRIVKIPEMIAEQNRTPYLDQYVVEDDTNKLAGTFKTYDRFNKYVKAQEKHQHIPIATNKDLAWADGVIWGFPTYYGMMPSQVKLFLEFAAPISAAGALEGKPTGVFTSAGSIHTGHEASILTSIVPLLHFGMIFVGLPYTENPEFLTADSIGCSPYGASTLVGPDSSYQPEPRELLMVGRLGKRVATIAQALKVAHFIT